MTTQTTKVKNGTITLPKEFRKAWKEADVFIFPNKDTLIIKKLQKPFPRLSEIASKVSSKKMSQKEIKKEIRAYRKKRKK